MHAYEELMQRKERWVWAKTLKQSEVDFKGCLEFQGPREDYNHRGMKVGAQKMGKAPVWLDYKVHGGVESEMRMER